MKKVMVTVNFPSIPLSDVEEGFFLTNDDASEDDIRFMAFSMAEDIIFDRINYNYKVVEEK